MASSLLCPVGITLMYDRLALPSDHGLEAIDDFQDCVGDVEQPLSEQIEEKEERA
jgi:hypothetical protein